MEGGDGLSEDGSGDVPWTARDQADHDFKMARERSRQMELELELAKLRPASPSVKHPECRKLNPHQSLRSRSELVKGLPDDDQPRGDEDQLHCQRHGVGDDNAGNVAHHAVRHIHLQPAHRPMCHQDTTAIPPHIRGGPLDSQEPTFQLLQENV
ncbi:hypothetical protein HPB51_006486 [Rhipicephalus microplus]|uniref:Uncharacterized protein n=1 Tax=Rhipicephalus microplus TaxID=6941 RepID=A0A9J6E6W0_RHIMP|nr:hypothetical protein HPB51_006486 [Rhipicephalus microplus]